MTKVIRRKSAAMDAFVKAGRGRLLGHVERHMLSLPEDTSRRQDIIHPSALCKDTWCPRGQYLVIKGKKKVKERHGLRTQNIFDEGHFIHDKWQRRFWDMGNLYGKFECLSCYHTWWDQSPRACPKCNHVQMLKYKEVPLDAESKFLIVGHADGWLKGLGSDCMIEVKSVGTGTVRVEAPRLFAESGGDVESIWKDLKRPFPSHLKQGQMYLRLANETLKDAPKEIVFIYEAKFNQDVKEFVVRYDKSFTDTMIEGALLVRHHIENNTLPPCINGTVCPECKGATS